MNQSCPDHDHRPPANSHGCPHCLEEATARIAELEAALAPLVRLYAGQITNTGEYYPQLFDAAKIALNPK